ncbi:MAG: CopD family protein [Gemmatimonadetes bacterium]|nr:CopD family protein [Gemmatimonadota bacterium]
MPWYLYAKIFHLIGMVSWMAGLFYLPRLFVYHAEARALPEAARGPVQTQLGVMMGRLLHIITVPALVMTCLGGVAMLLLVPALLTQPWLQVKLALVLALVGYTVWCARVRAALARGETVATAARFRVANEVPTVALVLICTYVVLKDGIGLLGGVGVSLVMIVLLGVGIQAYAKVRARAG